MAKQIVSILLLLCVCVLCMPAVSTAEALTIDFDQKMLKLWKTSAWWGIIIATEYLPENFSLHPNECDINGGFDISVKPIDLYPNGMLESDEFALIAAILADPSFDMTSRGGASHQIVYDAWTQNFNQASLDLGCCVGGPENAFTMFPEIEYLIAGLVTLGDQDSLAFPELLLDLVVNNSTVAELVHDPNISAMDLDNYKMLRHFLAWCGDADGDGCSNFTEYMYYYPRGGRAAYISAAMDPSQRPPGCSGNERLCDGSGGLYGEYFNTRRMKDLVLSRVDQQVTFNWGAGSPSPLVNKNDFTVCWTGWIIPDFTEDYNFYTRTDDGVRLWVNNELLIDKWIAQSATTHTSVHPLALEAGKKYPIRVDFYEQGGDAVAWLGWSSNRQTNGEPKAIREINTRPGFGMGDRSQEWIQNPYNGHMYKLTEPMPWMEGRDYAASLSNVYMAIINDEQENEWIRHTFGITGGDFYIGAHDLDEEGRWVWEETGENFWNGAGDGTPVEGQYSNWKDGEPNNYNDNEHVGAYYYSSGTWNDLSGTSSLPVLLESNTGVLRFEGPLPGDTSLRAGRTFQFEIDMLQSWGTVVYQWTHNGTIIPGEKDAILRFDPVTEEDSGLYACRMTDGTGAYGQTEAVMLEVTPGVAMPLISSWISLVVAASMMSIMAVFVLIRRKRCP